MGIIVVLVLVGATSAFLAWRSLLKDERRHAAFDRQRLEDPSYNSTYRD